MKHLHNFDTVAEYEAVKDTLEMPYIVPIDETEGLQYNTDVIRVPQGSGGSGGGGTLLESEYFLAKPNGRYWKFKFANMQGRFPSVYAASLTEEAGQAIMSCYNILGAISLSAIGDRSFGITTSGDDVHVIGPTSVAKRVSDDLLRIFRGDMSVSLLAAFQECSCMVDGVELPGLVDFIRDLDGGDFIDMTDDEILTAVSEIFMLEQVTKEEYESWYNW